MRRPELERDRTVEDVTSYLATNLFVDLSDNTVWQHERCPSCYLIDVLHVDIVLDPTGRGAKPSSLKH